MQIAASSTSVPGFGDQADARVALKNQKAARDFEAMLLTPVLDSLQETFAGDSADKTIGASDYRHMATEALVQAIAERGGIGIGKLILSHLQAPKVSMVGGNVDPLQG
jgi:Rod binding domain-containing protein